MTESTWTETIGEGPILAIANHAGHVLRPEVEAIIALDEAQRLREEDPWTDSWTQIAPTRWVATHSRFEVDFNRPREQAVYLQPEDAWGLRMWQQPPPVALVERSRAQHDAFFATLENRLRAIERKCGRFVILDLHSYNHRRDGKPAPPEENPQVNVGTGTMDRQQWAPVVETFMRTLSAQRLFGAPIDVRENVRFTGGYVAYWVHRTFPATGCLLGIEVKKTFMNEWTGELDRDAFEAIGAALHATVAPITATLATL